ncbi:MAG: AAA family ATPase [Marinilabiliaceae bacterium]|nr:AAA family ATPase [Marinilabiliaceae bacterium]
MRINILQLHNFRNFENATFSFPSLFTVVIGENGKGKSSLLEGIRVAAAAFLLGIDEADRFHIQKEDVRRVDIGNRFATQRNCFFKAEGSVMGHDIAWKRTLSREGGRTDTKDAASIIQLAQSLNDKVNLNLEPNISFPVICYFSTARLWAESKQTVNLKKKGSKLKDGYIRCVDGKSDKMSPMQWIKSSYWKKLKNKSESVLLDAVLEAIETCVPNWAPMEWDEDTDDLAGIYNEKDYIPLYYLSDGLRTMAALVAEIAYRCVVLNEHLGINAVKESTGIVMIDELDMHLHPNWQRNVVADLKKAFPKIQFVATTHSPFIVQTLQSNELINLDSEDYKSMLEKDPLNFGIEDVSQNEMLVDDVERSEPFKQRLEVAEKYFALINKGLNSQNSKEVAALRDELNKLEERFSDDPTFVAHLKAERKLKAL